MKEYISLEKETKCNFEISEKRKQIWNIELDLLFKLDEVCKKYNLNPETYNRFISVIIKNLNFKESVNLLNPQLQKVKPYLDAVKELLEKGDISDE